MSALVGFEDKRMHDAPNFCTGFSAFSYNSAGVEVLLLLKDSYKRPNIRRLF